VNILYLADLNKRKERHATPQN